MRYSLLEHPPRSQLDFDEHSLLSLKHQTKLYSYFDGARSLAIAFAEQLYFFLLA